MKSRKFIAGTFVSKVITATSLVFFSLSGSAVAGGNKVEVCHFPAGDKTKGKVVTVSKRSLGAHLEYGDVINFELYNDGSKSRCRESVIAVPASVPTEPASVPTEPGSCGEPFCP
ncbi:MAG: hypothetical protein IMF07_09365 [Proteobacteria bacterium]|nr:hypothetical protein [Pseudomonadota bacterium]